MWLWAVHQSQALEPCQELRHGKDWDRLKFPHIQEMSISRNDHIGVSLNCSFQEAIVLRVSTGINLPVGGNKFPSQADQVDQRGNVVRVDVILALDMRSAQHFHQFHHHGHRIYDRKATITQMSEHLPRDPLPADKRAGQHVRVKDGAQGSISACSFNIGGYFFIAVRRVRFG